MFNHTTSALLDLYKYSFIDRIFIKLQTRALGAEYERLFIVLPVLIFMNTNNQERVLANAKRYLLDNVKPKNLALKIYDRVMLRLFSYKRDNTSYIQDRNKAFAIFKQHIQLFGIVDKILDESCADVREMLEDIVRKQYDETYNIKDHALNLLKFQEAHYL